MTLTKERRQEWICELTAEDRWLCREEQRIAARRDELKRIIVSLTQEK